MVSRDTYDPGNPDHNAFREQREALAAEKRREYLKHVLSSPPGRNVVWHLIASCGVFDATFTSDAMLMAHNEGKRHAGLSLLLEVTKQFPELYAKMQQEAQAEETEEALAWRTFIGA